MNSPETLIFFHCYSVNNWKSIVRKLFRHFKYEKIFCSQIGTKLAEKELLSIAAGFHIKLEVRRFEDPETYEHEAIIWILDMAKRFPNHQTLYFHTKGVLNRNSMSSSWRNFLSSKFVRPYKRIAKEFSQSDCDASGIWYTERPDDPDMDGTDTKFFAGNFWIAKNKYLNNLPDYDELRVRFNNTRFLAERYIGFGDPKVLFLNQNEILPIYGKNGVYPKIKNLKWWGWQFRSKI